MNTQSEPGAPTRGIPLSVPDLSGNEWTYLKECLDTGWVSSAGAFVDRFEQGTVSAMGGEGHAVAVINGTAALHLALLAVGVRPDDEVLVPTLTFIAPANAVRYTGAWPVFVDAEADYWQMDVEQIGRFLDERCDIGPDGLRNSATGRRVSAILPVHILGHPVDMDPLLELAKHYRLAVVEDATESFGALYRGELVGTLGDVGCLSFNGNKLLTTGGGGIVLTSDEAVAQQVRHLSTQAKADPLEYVHDAVGYNYRLTNIQAALGVAQLERVAEFLVAKREIARRYAEAFADVSGLRFMESAPWADSAWWLSTALVDEVEFGCSSRELLARLGKLGIETRPLWQPLHRSPAHAGSPTAGEGCPVADWLAAQALSLPSSVGLAESDQQRVIAAISH
jgi:perosamine synthetase